ncbi:MAG: DNA polymerase III subunit alpha [Mycoplasma sp.]|nr:DNA polymerase III subunit alpha [Mycoplasma sp.]
MKKLINLHTNTEYSLLESTIKLDSLINFAKENELNSLTITDRNTLYGIPEFVEKCNKENIKPIIGIDLDVDDFRLILLAKNYRGYKHLMKLAEKKAKKGSITIKDIDVSEIFIIDHPTEGHFAKYKKQLFLHNYYVGVNKGTMPKGVAIINSKILHKSENKALSILHSIKHGKTKVFNELPLSCHQEDILDTMIEQANSIAEQCNVIFPKFDSSFPKFKTPQNISSINYLKQIIKENAKEKFKNIEDKKIYINRIKYEINIIEKLGFSDYFLIIWDMISWSKKQGILVGPGRGSAAGSIISYLLDITEINPIKHGLLFERFLNPERITMPDIDIDIQDNRRDEVIEYMFKKYGNEKTALIVTFSKLGAKMALRDSARALGIPTRVVDTLSKSIKLNETLKTTYNNIANFKAQVEKDPKIKELFEAAKSIEGLPRNIGTHAAGIVISQKDIIESVPTTLSASGHNQTQYSMNYMESNGLLKIDILGLRNLTIIQNIQKEIYLNFKKNIVLKKIKLNDKETNKLLYKGDINGIFQLESYGMKNTLSQISIDSFDDLSAAISLFRPGPMEFIKVYANRKKGIETIPDISPEYNILTKDTYGIIVYQEQIMQIAQVFAGMDFSQADILRRAISKKKKNLIFNLKEIFIKGALKNGHKQETIENVYKAIESFAEYGFNKSHAVSYAVISYRMAFLKAKFPLEFYTSILNSSLDSQKTIKLYVNECKRKGIKIISPNINESKEFVFNKNKTIILPLNLIKGLGKVAQEKILLERNENGLFEDFFSFIARMLLIGIGTSTIMSLINTNSLKEFGNVQSLTDSLNLAIRYAEMITSVKDGIKTIDFNILEKPIMITTDRNIKQEIVYEEKLLGMNYNVFYTDPFKTKETLIDLEKKDFVIVAIYVERIKKVKDKNNNEFAIITCHDSTNRIEATIFASIWKFIESSKSNKVYIVEINKRIFKGKESYIINKPWKEANE